VLSRVGLGKGDCAGKFCFEIGADIPRRHSTQ
jgi:hypothetical protein